MSPSHLRVLVVAITFGIFPRIPLARAAETSPALSLEQIMSAPDWIGQSPEQPFLSFDGRHAYFQRKEPASDTRNLWRVALTGGPAEKLSLAEQAAAESSERIFPVDRSAVAWLQRGNVFYQNNRSRRQLTRTGDATALLTFLGSDRVAFRAGKRVLAVDLKDGLVSTLATLEVIADPDEPEKKEFLAQQEERLFDIVRLREERRLERLARDNALAAAPAGTPRPIYFGKDKELRTVSLSPDGRTLLVGLAAAGTRGRREHVTSFINADGYTKAEDARSNVGTDKPRAETLFLVDLSTGKKRPVSLKGLPGLDQDPLAELRAAAAARKKAAAEKSAPTEKLDSAEKSAPAEPAVKSRPVYLTRIADSAAVRWSTTGRVAVMLMADDNKDRWIAEVSLPNATVSSLHRLTDPAWVCRWEFNEFDWLPDGTSLWFTSEESGYSHLYLLRDGSTKALTRGKYEVTNVTPTRDGAWFYYRANASHPGNHEVYRIRADGSVPEAITALGGENTFELSTDDQRLLIVHSTATQPPELVTQSASPGGKVGTLTASTTPEFAALKLPPPEYVTVPSRAGAAPIYSRLYRDVSSPTTSPSLAAKRPAVMFIHGAGYLQNAHKGWSTYFREFLFHRLLVQRGFVVLDMDYRGSAGYGRDWRTAIYTRMGTPELEDYLDGAEWLAKHAGVDRSRIGIYGGSYGGFLTLMALFKEPDAFAAGAALRPVTDWSHYNHAYTADILNTPDLDPAAYARSSPIEFAAGLRQPLLICSGMLDDNVFFQDSVRLVQRLIELKKERFEFAPYPVESHGFKEPTSWLDEYRRIYRLMDEQVKNRLPTTR